MVNTRIISRFTGPPGPPGAQDPEASRGIGCGPLYPVEEVLALLHGSGSQAICPCTKDCIDDLQKWSLDTNDVFALVMLALHAGRYIGSEWCVQKPNGPWAACDAYSVRRSEPLPAARGEIEVEYYLKFAISGTGLNLLLISCHPSEDKGQ